MFPTLLQAAALGGDVAPVHDMSALGLFLQADIVVKLVMLGLLAASVWTWAIIFNKATKLRRMKAVAADFEEQFWSGGSLDQLYDQVAQAPADPFSAVFAAGMREWRHANERGLSASGAMRANLMQRM